MTFNNLRLQQPHSAQQRRLQKKFFRGKNGNSKTDYLAILIILQFLCDPGLVLTIALPGLRQQVNGYDTEHK